MVFLVDVDDLVKQHHGMGTCNRERTKIRTFAECQSSAPERTWVEVLPEQCGCCGMKPTRIVVVNSHPIQYFAPLYRFLNMAPDLDVTAVYLSDISIRGGKDPGFD